MTDLARLTKRPVPGYKAAQASSYDRASKNPATDWFANSDAGNFVRIEDKAGRKEYVLADLKGPGAVTRLWSANPVGRIRFYFDGESDPRIDEKMADLMTGKVEPFGSPFAYEAARGANFYFPIPYSKSLKITVDDSEASKVQGLYYHVGYRTYPDQVTVTSFNTSELRSLKPVLDTLRSELNDPDKRKLPTVTQVKESFNMNPGSGAVIDLPEGPMAVYELRVKVSVKGGIVANPKEPWDSPLQLHNALRKVVLMMQFDDDFAVNVPLGDFFGSAPGLNPYKTFPMEVRSDGWMICRFVMPYGNNAAISFANEGQMPVTVEAQVRVGKYAFDANTYLFKSQWTVDQGLSQPHRDMTFLDASGEGVWLGSMLHVANPSPFWWGEGDEKVYVDGETFPSTFGTGTEDYYGYAWCDTGLFSRPYHAQTRVDGPANFGHTSVNRWHVLDPIPFSRSLRFDMEMWHWAEVSVTYARTSYWYAKPGGTAPAQLDRPKLLPELLEAPKPVPGAIEGEDMQVISKTGGIAEAQAGLWGPSNGRQLWWHEPSEGDKLVIEFTVPQAGEYEVLANLCHNRDYGIHRITVGGNGGEPIDFYSDKLEWRTLELGTFRLPAGPTRIEVVCAGRRPEATAGNMFGLDYLMLKKKS